MEFDQQIAFQSIIAEDENQNNVKLGDIIYLKAYLPEDNKGIISGEGFGTNKLECLLMQKQMENHLAYKQAELNIFTCLFRVLSVDQQKTEISSNETNGEIESEINVIYGQEIHLVHLYSKTFLTINSQALAKENCCRELKLEPIQNQNSAFLFSSNTKNYGEPVLYGDILYFKSSVPHLNQWGLGIQQNYPHTEVNASQIACALKICSYHEHFEDDHQVMNGDIIIFKNRLFGGYLSVTKNESVKKYLQIREIFRNDEQINQHFLNIPYLKKQENTNKMFTLYLDHEVKPNSMWQLLGITQVNGQKDKNKQFKKYLIKNVLTGAFLQIENDKISLTFEQISEKCLFSLKNLQKSELSIQIGEFYRLISNGMTIQCENEQDVNITGKNEKIYFDQQMFQVKRGPFEDAVAANKIQQFYFHTLEFYAFLQDWGLDQQYRYQYNLAFYSQKQAQDEINQFYKLLKNIKSFLNASQQIQNKKISFLLCKYDILDSLIIVLRQISIITQSEANKTSFFHNKSLARIARQKFSPQLTATNKKQIHLVSEIYELIYTIIFDNAESCNYLIEQESTMDFLFSQLSQQRIQIERILKQALSKAQFSSHTVLKWIHKLRPISEENLEDQIFILDIINSLISFQNKISVQCQNLCRKQLFVSKVGSKYVETQYQSCLLKCSVSNDQLPYVCFLTEDKKFYSKNFKICDFHKQNYQGYQSNWITFESFIKYDAERAYQKYEKYIINVLSLFARLCKGRNFKNMIIIKETAGVTRNFLESFQTSKHSLQCKKVVIDLFIALYYDIDPLTKISTFENTCYLRRELIDFDKELESGRYFYENISSNKIKRTDTYLHFQQGSLCTEENAEFLQLRAYSNHIVTSQKYQESFISLFLQLDYPDFLIEDANLESDYISVANRQLSFFLSLIRLINNSIELGYNTLSTNRQIQETLRYIFVVLIIQQKNKFQFCKFKEDVAFTRNLEEMRKQMKPKLKDFEKQFTFNFESSWITEFLLWTTSVSNNQELFEFIFSAALNIYRVLFYLQSNLQILNYLSQKICNSSEMFSNHNTLLFHCLFGQSRLLKLNNEIMDYLVLSFNQQMYNLKEIKEVEILDDNVELKYFSLINGHSQSNDLIGPKEIQHYLKKAIRYVTQQPKNQNEVKELELSFQEVEKYLVSLNQLFEETINENKAYLHSIQNMMRNAQIHGTFLKFLLNPNEIKVSTKIVYFYRRIIKFFESFTKNNQTNFQILLPFLNQIFKIILIPQPDADKFTYQSLQLSKLELWKAPGSIIEYIVDVSKNLDLQNNIIHIRAGRQYLKILQGLTKTQVKPGYSSLSNQRLILHLLLQHFRDLIDPINYFGDMDNFSKFQQTMQQDILHFQKLKLHATTLSLIADTCKNYTLGIQEAQRILIFEQLASVLQSGPYLVKAAYLKCIFELYINFVKFNNQVNEIIDTQQTKELISQIIIPDLEQMQQFSSGSSIKANILISNNEFWKYIKQVTIFFISLLDEYRDRERYRECNFFQELQIVQKLFQGLLLNNSTRIVQEQKELLIQLIEIISDFKQKIFDLSLRKRILLFCVRNNTQFTDLITCIEQLKSFDNLLKLQELCNQHNKVYITTDDIDTAQQQLNQSQDQKTQQTLWFNFKKQLSNYQESSDTNGYSQARETHEKALEVLKDEFKSKKEEEISFRLSKSKVNFENYEILSEDVQILLLIDDLERQPNGFLTLTQLKDFLIQCKIIFTNHPIYLIKICKILLESKKPNKETINQDAIDLFAQYQNAIAESEMDILSIEALQNQDLKIQLDALTLLQNILDFGNFSVQQRLYQLMQSHKKLKKIFIQFCKEFFSQDIHLKLEELRQEQTTVYSKVCLKLLEVMQGLCENVHLEFQKFLKVQNVKDSITANLNFIFETTNLLAHFMNDNQVEDSKKWEIYQQGMYSLIEFSTGLPENKREITKNTRFFSSFNQLLNNPNLEDILKQVGVKNRQQNYQYLQTISIYIKLIISMLEGDAKENKSVYKFFLDTLDINLLLIFAKQIYQYRIFPKKKVICVDQNCQNPCKTRCCSKSNCINNYKTIEDELLIQTGLNIFIIGLKLSNFSSDDRYKLFKFEVDVLENNYENESPTQINPADFIEKTFSVSAHPSIFSKVVQDDYQVIDEVQEEVKQVSIIKRTDEFFEFYREFVGRIEVVNQNGQIERVLFQRPFVCKYVTTNIKFHLIYQSNRESDEDRVASLLENVDFYHSQMRHYQHISNFSIMHFGQRHWRKLKDVSYIICVFLVIFFILMPESIMEGNLYQGDETSDNVKDTKTTEIVLLLNNIITIIQLVLNLLIIIFCAVERYPIAVNFSSAKNNARRIQILKKEAGFKIPEYEMRYYNMVGYLENNLENQQITKSNFKRIILLLLIDFDNLYNIIIFGITIIAFFNTYVYAILLLDIIKRSEDLQNIIKAITDNVKNLLLFGLLGLIGLVLYGFLLRLSFSGSFQDDTKYAQDSLGYSIAHSVNLGLRNGGGVGDSLEPYANPFEQPGEYWSRYFFDFTFFIIFNILFIQMIFGIIVDKFGDLRDQRQDLIKDIQGKCFICSMDRNEIDSKTKNGWFYHIYLEHNVYHMLYYLIYIKQKPITECNSLEKYIKDQINNQQSDFFPVKSTFEIKSNE